MASLFGTLLWDRLCTMLFAPRIFKAMLDEAKTTTAADLMPALQSLGKVVGVLLLLGTGNILFMIGAWWMYKKYSNEAQQRAEQQAMGGS